MIQKGTTEYKMAQELATKIVSYATTTKRNNSFFSIAVESLNTFLYEIKKSNTFAAKIAETVDKTLDIYGFQVAKVSQKQAWVLATTAVELGINL